MRLRMSRRGPWRGPSAPHVPCLASDQSCTKAFLARGAFRVPRNFVSDMQNRSMRRADLHAARTGDDVAKLSRAYPQPLRAAAYERGRIDG